MNKAVFLDRDGTINEDFGYVHLKENFKFLPNSISALKLLQEKGFLLVIITNQSGIARGFYTKESYYDLNSWMLKKLRDNGVEIARTYFCPHHPNGIVDRYKKQCECRKPQTGLFYRAIKDFDIDVNNSYAIGNQARDVEICKTTGVRGYVLYSKDEKIQDNIVYIKGGILDAVKCIMKREEKNEAGNKENY